jgi:hypothetical protein
LGFVRRGAESDALLLAEEIGRRTHGLIRALEERGKARQAVDYQ